MKKHFLSMSLFASTFLLVALSFLPSAMAQTQETIDAIQVTGLKDFQGKYLTVFFANGQKASVQFQDDQVKIKDIKGQATVEIKGSQVTIPATQIRRDYGFVGQMNVVVFVVHDHASFQWINLDGSPITNQKAGVVSQPQVVNALSRTQLMSLKNGNIYQLQLSY